MCVGPLGPEGPKRTGNLRINRQHKLERNFFGILKITSISSFIEEEWRIGETTYWSPLRIEDTYIKI